MHKNNIQDSTNISNNNLPYFASNLLKITKINNTISSTMIERYPFLRSFINFSYLFFEDIYFSIIYIQEEDQDEEIKENYPNKKKYIIIHNFIINKIHKTYCKNSMNYEEFKDSLLNLYFGNLKKSFLYSNLHLSGYEYDFNNDINDWLNKVLYIDTIFYYHYGSKILTIDKDYVY